nr:Chitinase-like protein [Ipomoea batatas]
MDDLISRLVNLTSYIAQQFFQFIEDLLVFRDVNRCSQESVAIESGKYTRDASSSRCCSSSLGECHPTTRLGVHSCQIGDNFPLYSLPRIVKHNVIRRSVNLVFKGVTLPVFGLKFGWRLMSASWNSSFCYARCAHARVQRFISRVSTTLHGSSGDIGWMQRDPRLAPVEDGSARFSELLQEIRNGNHMLPDCFVYLLIPGLFSNLGPLYFVTTKKFFSKMGLACHIAKIQSEASVEKNAWELKQYIEELYWGSGKCVMLLGHSKGGIDAAAALSIYWHDLKDKVAGLAFVQSPYGGSPVASDILREGQIADKETRRIMEFIVCKIFKGDMQALDDLTYEKRKEFVKNHTLPSDIPLVSFHSEARVAPGVIATMSHIAQAELPWIPIPRLGSKDAAALLLQSGFKVPVILPVSAALALCALHLQLRYGEKSDGLVTCRDAQVPGSVVVKPDKKLDHAWMVYSCWRNDPLEPGASEMCEALLTMLVEIAKRRK